MATMNVSLPDPMKAWDEAQTQDGRYSNASDYVRDLIRRDQDRQQAIAELEQLVDEGLASGPAGRLDVEAFLARKRDQNARTDGPSHGLRVFLVAIRHDFPPILPRSRVAK